MNVKTMADPPVVLHGVNPDLYQLQKKGVLAADMHVHTTASDGLIRVQELLKVARKQGAWVGITDHNDARGAIEAFSLEKSPLVVPGIEVSCREGPHILVWFYDAGDLADFYTQNIIPNRGASPWMAIQLSTEEVIERARQYSSIIAAAHPWGYWCLARGLLKCATSGLVSGELTNRVDALEVISGGMSIAQNRSAEQAACDLGLGMTGGSDSHLLSGVWSSVTTGFVDDRGGLLDAIRKRETGVIGRPLRHHMKLASAVVISAMFAPYCIPSLKVHLSQTANRARARMNGDTRGLK